MLFTAMQNLELLVLVADGWLERLAKKYEQFVLEQRPIPCDAAYRFLGLQCKLTRQQARLVSDWWQQRGLLQKSCAGWTILKPAVEVLAQ